MKYERTELLHRGTQMVTYGDQNSYTAEHKWICMLTYEVDFMDQNTSPRT
jgi:hypothetical protein